MTVALAIAKLATVLATVDPTPQPAFRRVYSNPAEAVNVADMPSAVICLAPGVSHTWTEEALGLGRHDYILAIYVFLGIRQTPLPELHARALPWPEAIMRVLAANITLGGVVNQLGFGGDPKLYTYKLGPIQWSDQLYWGLTLQLPVVEKPTMTMGAGS